MSFVCEINIRYYYEIIATSSWILSWVEDRKGSETRELHSETREVVYIPSDYTIT